MRLAARASTASPAQSSAIPPYSVPPSTVFDGNDGSWSTFTISVGTPGQDLRVLPSTKSGVTFVVLPEGCQQGIDPPGCAQARGAAVFNSQLSPGFQTNVSNTWSAIGQYDVDLEQSLGIVPGALYGFDKIWVGQIARIRSALQLSRQVVGGLASMDYYLGMLPLGQAESSFSSLTQPVPSLLWQLRNTSQIPSFSYAYTAGAKYRKSVLGSLTLGGYDTTRFRAPDNGLTFTFSTETSKLLTVAVDSIMASDTLKGTFSLTSGAYFSVIDSTAPHLWLPTSVCAQFEQAFGLTYDPKTDLYLVNDTIHQQLLAKNPSVTIKLSNSLANSASNYTNIMLPYGAFDLQASYPYYPNATNYFPIRRAANDTQYILGRTFLQEAYLIVDYERANFTVAQTVFSDPPPASNLVAITSPSEKHNKTEGPSGLGTGAIIGIAVGGAIAFFIAVFAVFLFFRRRKNKKQPYELAGNQTSDAGSSRQFSDSPTQMKAQGPSELNGTPLTELASPVTIHYPTDHKTAVSINDAPVELPAESRAAITPRWEEVRMPPRAPQGPYEADGASNGSRSVSQFPSDDGLGTGELGPRSGVSPLTGQFLPLNTPH